MLSILSKSGEMATLNNPEPNQRNFQQEHTRNAEKIMAHNSIQDKKL